jgi:hypothetical protein
MQQKSLFMLAGALPLVVALQGCGAPPDGEGDVAAISAAATAENGLAYNGLAYNGMAYNGLAFNGLAFNGLAYNGLAYNGLAFNGMAYNGLPLGGLSNPTVDTFVSYLVGCALPAGDSVTYDVDGISYRFAGDLGLAREWKYGACGESCQGWVSACMLARLNKKGEHVQISMRGQNPALALEPGEDQWKTREGSYYGNLFERKQPIFSCYNPGTPELLRVCGPSLDGCPMQVVGACDDACKGVSKVGAFRDCSSTTRKHDGDVYQQVITVFLR